MRNRLSAVALFVMSAAASPTTACIAQASSRATAPDSSWVRNSAIYEVFVRDFSRSGDFRGVTRGLDRIQAVGANVVWLMPIYPVGMANRKGSLGSPYAVRDYLAVNPEFGTVADFKALVQAVHAHRVGQRLGPATSGVLCSRRQRRAHRAAR
jgi:1,4-alpha-glucan branching enzyme